MHGNLVPQFLHFGVVRRAGGDIKQHADLSAAMNVRRDETGLVLKQGKTTNLNIFTDFRYGIGGLFGNALATGERSLLQAFQIGGSGSQSRGRNTLTELEEIVGLGNEIGFRVDFHQNGPPIFFTSQHDTFRSHPARFLRRGRQTFLPQDIHRLIHISVGFGQSLFAIHHSGTGLGTQRRHIRSIDSHSFLHS